MPKTGLLIEKVNDFDKNGLIKKEVDIEFGRLKELRQKYPFVENLASIEWLDPDKLFNLNPDQVGELFTLIEAIFKPFGNPTLNCGNVYRNARLQIRDLKNLLRTGVDDRKSLAQKIDAPWERIGGFGQDKLLAKKIICCFNYEKGTMFPIFSNQHLRHFVNRATGAVTMQTGHRSLGQEYEYFTAELLKAKNSLPPTRNWSTIYFARFLYSTYPPPDTERPIEKRKTTFVTDEQLDMQSFVNLLGELQHQGKITGEQFRQNRNLWMQQAAERQELTNRLKKLL